MDSQVKHQLMIQVERCVRPILAANFRKDRMRRELLSHLTEAYSHERMELNDDRQALERTLQRFGNIEHVRGELQSSVPRIEQFLFRPVEPVGSIFCLTRRPNESGFKFTLRQGVVGGLWYLGFLLLLAIISMILTIVPGAAPQHGTNSRFVMLPVAGVIGCLMIVVATLGNYFKTTAILQRGFFSLRSACTTIVVVASLTVMILVLLESCDLMARVPIFPISNPSFIFWCALIFGTIFELTSIFSVVDRRRSDEWDVLDVESQIECSGGE